MKRLFTRIAFLFVVACSNNPSSTAVGRLASVGTMTAEIRQLAQRTCADGVLMYAPHEKAISSLPPTARHHFTRAKIIALHCDPTNAVEIVLSPDNQAIYSVFVFDVSRQLADQWLGALARAGMNAELVRQLRASLESVVEAPAIESPDHTIRASASPIRAGANTWKIDARILK